uniref:Ankyrin repeat and SOCS box containing 13 n=1 Tax=Sinocyclocheilus grahami TaxID=75366 RepID=A0A672KZ15_SINGR
MRLYETCYTASNQQSGNHLTLQDRVHCNCMIRFYIVAYSVCLSILPTAHGLGFWTNRSAVHEAAAQGRAVQLQKLIENGASVNIVAVDSITPLHEACIQGQTHFILFLFLGANVNAAKLHETALYHAAKVKNLELTELLVEFGGNVFARDNLRKKVSDVTALAGGSKTKGKLEAAHSNQRRFGYIRSLKYHLVVMLGARIDLIQPQIRNLIAYLLPLPDKKNNDSCG